LPNLLRRVAVLTLISVSGIALLAPLAARSTVDSPVDLADDLLPRVEAPPVALDRGSTTDRQATVIAAAAISSTAALEEFGTAPLPTPATASMEATLLPVATPAPTPPPSTAPTRRPAATYSGDSVWDDLAKCESGGNWSINTGNGYYGGLQFSYSTWHGYGGGEFAEYPHEATREEQIIVAERLRAARGYQPWPACRSKLGLP
jgi:Transglycosylase-like domain